MQIRQLRLRKTDVRTLLKISLSIALASMFLAATLAYSKNSDKRIPVQRVLTGNGNRRFAGISARLHRGGRKYTRTRYSPGSNSPIATKLWSVFRRDRLQGQAS